MSPDALRAALLAFPERGSLDIGTAFHMLVGVILSARTKDEQVLRVLPRLLSAYPHAEALARASASDIEPYIATIGLYKSKARALERLGKELCERHGGVVPGTFHELVELSGVGRKTASVLLAARFSRPAIAVDTHVFRIVRRLGWSTSTSVVGVEKDLLRGIPEDLAPAVNTVMVPLGRMYCTAKPLCGTCPLAPWCLYAERHKKTHPSSQDVELLEKRQKIRESLAELKRHTEHLLAHL